jgi:spoIIIJ-associated protein
MSYIDVTGKTEDEAIRKALEQLHMDRDDVSVEILERAKSGFLGIGSSPARVRVTYGQEEPEAPAAPVQPEKKPEKKPEPKPQPKPQQPKPQKAEAPKAAPKAPEAPKAEEAPAAPAQELCQDDNARRITEFLTGLLEHMDSPARVQVTETEKGRYSVVLEGQKLGQLIGRRGETLDAIQQLTNYAVNSGREKRIRVHVDAENYRAKREQSLESLARKVAAKVTRYRRSVTLEPMNAYERHVIHAALQDVPGVNTYSIGSEPNRRVVVSYDRDKR